MIYHDGHMTFALISTNKFDLLKNAMSTWRKNVFIYYI